MQNRQRFLYVCTKCKITVIVFKRDEKYYCTKCGVELIKGRRQEDGNKTDNYNPIHL